MKQSHSYRLMKRQKLSCTSGLYEIYIYSLWASILRYHQRTMIVNKYKAAGEYAPKLTSFMLASDKQLEAICSNPELSFSGQTQRFSGNLTVLAKCGAKRHFVRVNVKTTGRYWVAKHTIQPGQPIKMSDMEEREGSLDNLASDLIFSPQQITDKIPTRMIKAGQPFTTSQLRKQWSVRAGEEISVISIGSGFHSDSHRR